MADPTGPIVARGPDEAGATSQEPGGESSEAAGEATSPGQPARAPDDEGGADAATSASTPVTDGAVSPPPTWPAAAASDSPTPAVDAAPDGAPTAKDDTTTPAEDAAVEERPDGGNDGDGDDGDGEDDEGAAARSGSLLAKKVAIDARVLVAVLAVAALLALTAGAYFLGQQQTKDLEEAANPKTPPTTAFVLPKEYATFNDAETGVKLSVPKEWTQRSTKSLGPAARMLLEVPGSDNLVIMRVNSYSQEVTPANLGDQKNVIDALFAEENLTILGVEAGDLKGMPVLVYVYRFTDPRTGAAGIHAHYFVFQGRKAVQMIFQALPEANYTTGGLGTVWSTIAQSLEVTKDPPPAFLEQLGGPATTAPGATTAPAPPAPATPPTTG